MCDNLRRGSVCMDATGGPGKQEEWLFFIASIANKTMHKTLPALRNFQHTCPLLWFGWLCRLPPTGQGAGGTCDCRR